MDNKPTYTVTDNSEDSQYQISLPDDTAFISYHSRNGNKELMHTEVPQQYEGKGIASTLARFAFEDARESGQKVVVYCPYLATYLRKHPEYNDVVVAVRSE
jgi:predicted GNAT family acetyltransferase